MLTVPAGHISHFDDPAFEYSPEIWVLIPEKLFFSRPQVQFPDVGLPEVSLVNSGNFPRFLSVVVSPTKIFLLCVLLTVQCQHFFMVCIQLHHLNTCLVVIHSLFIIKVINNKYTLYTTHNIFTYTCYYTAYITYLYYSQHPPSELNLRTNI